MCDAHCSFATPSSGNFYFLMNLFPALTFDWWWCFYLICYLCVHIYIYIYIYWFNEKCILLFYISWDLFSDCEFFFFIIFIFHEESMKKHAIYLNYYFIFVKIFFFFLGVGGLVFVAHIQVCDVSVIVLCQETRPLSSSASYFGIIPWTLGIFSRCFSISFYFYTNNNLFKHTNLDQSYILFSYNKQRKGFEPKFEN